MSEWDLFISHASEDKETLVRPLAKILVDLGLQVWYDEYTLVVGDSIRRGIERGLESSRFGVVILSPAFLKKEWPQKELDHLFSAESPTSKKILPVWHEISVEEIRKHLPLLADRIATFSSRGLQQVAADLVAAVESRERRNLAGVERSVAPEGSQEHLESSRIQEFYDVLVSEITLESLRAKKLLLVDDEELIHETITCILDGTEAKVEDAFNSQEAIEKFEEGDFDLVVSDIVMPGGDGTELARYLRDHSPQTPLVFMSGYSQVSARSVPHDVFLHKPFSPEKFLNVVRQALSRGSDPLYLLAESLTSTNPSEIYRLLGKCRSLALNFMARYSSNGLFETALRHKVKDSLRSYCSSQKAMLGSVEEARILLERLRRLGTLMRDIHRGSQDGLHNFLRAISADVAEEYPGLEIDLISPRTIPRSFEGTDVETLLCFCAMEFVDNALDAMNGGGAMELVVRKKITKDILFLAVRNDGPKIPSHQVDIIFEENFSTKGEGRGLGLSIIKNLVGRFGGTVALVQSSGVSLGVQFSVSIPIASE